MLYIYNGVQYFKSQYKLRRNSAAIQQKHGRDSAETPEKEKVTRLFADIICLHLDRPASRKHEFEEDVIKKVIIKINTND